MVVRGGVRLLVMMILRGLRNRASSLVAPQRRQQHNNPAARLVTRNKKTMASRMPEVPPESDSVPKTGEWVDWKKIGGDRRRAHSDRLAGVKQHDMELTFLGTASCTPSITRGVSCTALRYDGETWLFDAGEGTQIQIQRCSNVHPGSVSSIFVTHTHGDHSFGLPGLLCIIGQNREKTSKPIDIYGPEGLRLMIRTMLRLSHSRVAAPYRVHEMKRVPLRPPGGFMPPNGGPKIPRIGREFQPGALLGREHAAFGELEGGRDIEPDADGCWTLVESSKKGEQHGDMSVRAAPMVHTVPCVGFVVTEHDKPGRLDVEAVAPIVERNSEALKKRGVKQPKRVYRILKAMQPGAKMTFPDGTEVHADDVVSPPRPGRVVVVCGDTADASALLPLLPEDRGADVVIHEATNAHFPKFDANLTPKQHERNTIAHGHSTPAIAARFARRANASQLIMTHFSARYKGDTDPVALDIMLDIEAQGRAVFHEKDDPLHHDDDDTSVVAAWDFLTIPVPFADSRKAAFPGKNSAVDDDEDDWGDEDDEEDDGKRHKELKAAPAS